MMYYILMLQLRVHGYTNIDGFDASDKMLAIAQDRRLYRSLTQFSMDHDRQLPYEDSKYNVLWSNKKIECLNEFYLELHRI